MKLSAKLLIPIIVVALGAFVAIYTLTTTTVEDLLVHSRQDNLAALLKIKGIEFTDEELSQPSMATSTALKFNTLLRVDPSIFRIKVWNESGEIVYSDVEKLIGTSEDAYKEQVIAAFGTNGKEAWLSSGQQSGTPESTFSSYIVGITPLRSPDGHTHRVLEVYSSTALLFLGLRTFNFQMSGIYALVLLCLAIITFSILTFFVIRPIRALTVSAKEIITSGDLKKRNAIVSKDEIGELSASLNDMTSKLQSAHDTLETKIAEQTIALVEQVKETEESRLAVMNLLEDLEEEKKKVEQTVVERTEELNEEKARLLASIESLSFGFIIADTNDNVIVKNAAVSTTLELADDITSVRDIVDSFKGVASGLDVLVHSCRECIDLKKAVELKEISHGKKYLRVFCTPIVMKNSTQDVEDVTIGYVMLIEDITEAKVMERSRDEFFAVASHELRTPLTAIRGNADMILDMYADKIIDKDMKEMLQDIDISSSRLISVVNDFLEASHLEQGKVDIKKESFDVSPVIEKVVRDLTTMVSQKGLSIAYTAPPTPLPAVFADKNRTEQILLNLVGNATKFTREGGITITVKVELPFIGIRISDTGAGISEHNQALLFRKFQQAGEDMLARDVTQSTGLGLYISKLIISSMGGTIGLEKSELGKGSTFFFTLPVANNV